MVVCGQFYDFRQNHTQYESHLQGLLTFTFVMFVFWFGYNLKYYLHSKYFFMNMCDTSCWWRIHASYQWGFFRLDL
jgi:uncharacterized membrane protein